MTKPHDLLAARYRRLMYAYPRDFRTDRGPEVVGTLLDLAEPGQTWPRAADAVDLLGSGLRARIGRLATRGLAEGAQIAAPIAVALAGGIATFLGIHVEPTAHTLGPIAYIFWLAAALAWALPTLRCARALIATGIAVTLTVPELGSVRTPLWVVMCLVGFGIIALVGTAPADVVGGGRLDDRLAVPLGSVGVALLTSLVTGKFETGYYQPTIALVGIVVAAVLAVTATVAFRRLAYGQPSATWWWATMLLALPGGWLGPIGGAVADPATMPVHFGHLAEVTMATSIALAAMMWPRLSARTAGAVAYGVAFGLLIFAAMIHGISGWVLVTAITLALCGALLGAPSPRILVASFLGGVASAFAVAAYDNNWTLSGWTSADSTMLLVSTVAMVPFTLVAIVAVRRRGLRLLALAVAVAWIGRAILPYAWRWGPVLLLLALVALAVAAFYLPRWISATRASAFGARPSTSLSTAPDERAEPHR